MHFEIVQRIRTSALQSRQTMLKISRYFIVLIINWRSSKTEKPNKRNWELTRYNIVACDLSPVRASHRNEIVTRRFGWKFFRGRIRRFSQNKVQTTSKNIIHFPTQKLDHHQHHFACLITPVEPHKCKQNLNDKLRQKMSWSCECIMSDECIKTPRIGLKNCWTETWSSEQQHSKKNDSREILHYIVCMRQKRREATREFETWNRAAGKHNGRERRINNNKTQHSYQHEECSRSQLSSTWWWCRYTSATSEW